MLTSARNLRSVKEIKIYASKRSRYTLSENGIVHYAMTHCFRNIEGLKSTNLFKLLQSQDIFCYFNCQYFMNGV